MLYFFIILCGSWLNVTIAFSKGNNQLGFTLRHLQKTTSFLTHYFPANIQFVVTAKGGLTVPEFQRQQYQTFALSYDRDSVQLDSVL